MELPELKKKYPNNYKQFLTKPDPFKFLNTSIDGILLDDYAKKIGVKPDKERLKSLIAQQKKEFSYIINGMPQSEMDRMSKIDQETYKEMSKIFRDMIKASGMTPEEYFEKRVVPTSEYLARVEALEKQIEKNVKVPEPSSKEIEDFMKYRKGITKDEAISILKERKARSIAESKIKDLTSQLRKNANIKIIDEDSLKKLEQENP